VSYEIERYITTEQRRSFSSPAVSETERAQIVLNRYRSFAEHSFHVQDRSAESVGVSVWPLPSR
jgi:hypothetical protein